MPEPEVGCPADGALSTMTQQVSSVLTSFPPATPLDYSDLFAADVAIREYSAALARLDRDLQDAIIADPASLLQA